MALWWQAPGSQIHLLSGEMRFQLYAMSAFGKTCNVGDVFCLMHGSLVASPWQPDTLAIRLDEVFFGKAVLLPLGDDS